MKSDHELWERDFVRNYYSAIGGRIRDNFKIDQVSDISNIPNDRSFAYRALRKLSVINRISSVTEATKNGEKVDVVLPSVPDQELHDNSSIWFTINDAVALGYLWAKSEDQSDFITRATKAITEKQAAAGRKSGQTRAQTKADKIKIVKAIADEFLAKRTKHPTNEEIIDYVDNSDRWIASWKRLELLKIPKPARSGIADMVAELFGSQSRSAPKSGQ
jgi:hypothetical protein